METRSYLGKKLPRTLKRKKRSGKGPLYMKQKPKSEERLDPRTKRVTVGPNETTGIRIARRGGGRAYGKNS